MSRYNRHTPIAPISPGKRALSLPVLGFILASLLLASVLAVLTVLNMNREQQFMEKFLLQEAETLVRAFEAGARASMMMDSVNGNLATLVTETAREKNVAYILILDEQGQTIASAGQPPNRAHLPAGATVLETSTPQVRFLTSPTGQRIYEIAKEFNPLTMLPQRRGMMSRWRNWCGHSPGSNSSDCRQVIYLGLYTESFDAARKEDIKQSLLLLGILFLLSSGGLYALLLANKSRAAKEALENMELYTNNVINSMPAGLISLDPEQRIVTANSAALTIFGYSEADLRGKSITQLDESGAGALSALLRSDRELIEQPLDCLGRNGESIPLKVSASQLRDREGRLRGMVLILRDQREIKAMEEALERSRRHAALGRMAAGVAHEIRNPLGTLRGFAQYFSRSAKADPQAKEYAELMVGEVDRLNRTVSALLQFSRPREPEYAQIDLLRIAEKSLTFIQEEADSQGIALELQIAAPDLRIYADPDLLQQVLFNLLQNSLAATDSGGRIVLGGQETADMIQLWVEDSGKGLPQEEQAKMFDPFYTTRKDGTGLGLSLVQQIIEQHQGHIEVVSEPGQGCRITIMLPRRKEQS